MSKNRQRERERVIETEKYVAETSKLYSSAIASLQQPLKVESLFILTFPFSSSPNDVG